MRTWTLERYVEELGPAAVGGAHVSDAHGLLAEGLPYGSGELDLDPAVARLGKHVPTSSSRRSTSPITPARPT